MSTEAQNHEQQDFIDDIEIPEDERPPQQAESVSNELTNDLERGSPKPDRLSLDRNSPPTESQLEDIDIEQCDFVSEQSKVSTEDELIELLKSGAIDMPSPEYSRDSPYVAEEDPQESLVKDVQSFPEEEMEHSSVELDAFAGNNVEAKSGAESDSSDDVIERFEASLTPEERSNYMVNVVSDLEADGTLEGDEQERVTSDEDEALEREFPEREAPERKPPEDEAPEDEASEDEAPEDEAFEDEAPEDEASEDEASEDDATEDKPSERKAREREAPERGPPEDEASENEASEREAPERETPEHDKLEDTALSETSANIEKLVARLGEIENELSESEEEGFGIREATGKTSDEEFEEIERLLYEEKALIEAEGKSKQSAQEAADDSDEEFERLEKELYEQKARVEVVKNINEVPPEEFTKAASDDEFEQLEKMAFDEKATNRAQPDEFVMKGNEPESLSSDIENQVGDSKSLSAPPHFPVSSKKTEEDDDLLDIIGASDSEISDSSEDLEEVQKLIVAQASSDDRETLGSDEEEKNPVIWSVSVRTSAPAPPVAAAVASEHNVAFVSIQLMKQTTEPTDEQTKERTNQPTNKQKNEPSID